jgi:hypothetical protein
MLWRILTLRISRVFFGDLARGQYFGERIGQGWNSESFPPNADSSSINYRLGGVTPFVLLKAAFGGWGETSGRKHPSITDNE